MQEMLGHHLSWVSRVAGCFHLVVYTHPFLKVFVGFGFEFALYPTDGEFKNSKFSREM